jgi:hypothetical protein
MRGIRTIDRKKFLKGLLILLLTPVVALLLLAAYVYWANSRPQAGRLQTRVAPQVTLPGQEAAYYITLLGGEEKASAPPPPVDIAFLIDVSGSMTNSLPAMADAAHKVAQELASEKGRIRFSLIRFDTEAEVNTPWTEDPEALYSGLKHLQPFTNENDTRAAFVKLDGLLAQARPEAKKVVVFYTDGNLEACNKAAFGSPCPSGPMTESEMVEKAGELRSAGVDLYSIGLPGYGSNALMVQMTGASANVFDPVDAKDLAANFRLAAHSMAGISGEGGQLSHRLDGRHFAAPLEGTSWSVDRNGFLNLSVGKLTKAAETTFAHPLKPLSAGLWRVGVEPPQLLYAADDGRVRSLRAERRPLLLVITWWTLLWALLPAALWTLLYLTPPKSKVVETGPPLPELTRPRPPTLLPALPILTENREPPIPTLFLGLGGAGRRALHAARAELKQAHLGHLSQPYKFLWLDVDDHESARATRFEEWDEYPVKELTAPISVRRAQSYLPEPGKAPEHLKWFDAQRYLNASREELNLVEGTRGDRALGRLSFFQWLTENEDLLAALVDACRELTRLDSVDGTRQIVVCASPDGGVGGGWFLDIGRLLHRITRRQQAQSEVEFVPEVIGVWSEAAESANPANRNALELEFESAALTGAFPQRATYAPDHELLDSVDTESPYNWVFTVSAFDADSVAAQSAELAACFVERQPRTLLLKATDALKPRQLVAAQTRAIHVLPAQLYERIHYEIFLRTIGPETLLDIETAPGGGLSLRRVNEDVAARHLSEWAKTEPPRTPLQLLLAAASDAAGAAGCLRIMQESSSSPTPSWLAGAVSNSVTLRLHGHGDPDDSQWHRDWMPGDAIAVLRLLSARLTNSVRPEAQTISATANTIESIEHVAKIALDAADQLEAWAKEFCQVGEKFSQRHSELNRASAELGKLSGRTYLEPLNEQERVDRLTREIFATWLGTPDATSAIRQRLFFTTVTNGDSVGIALRSYIGSAKQFGTAAEAINALDEQARTLAHLAPAIRIGGVLAQESKEQRRKLAEGLVDTTTAPRQVLVVAPSANAGDEARVIEEFRQLVPQPPSHGARLDQQGDDHAAVRRVELAEQVSADSDPRDALPFVAAAEQQAELLRKRAEKKHSIAVAAFPPELRVALAYPAAFGSFARAYKAGHIVLREDAAGASQWAFLDTGDFLTFGPEPTLAKAAANYVWYISAPPTFDTIDKGGALTKLNQWQRKSGAADDDTLTLIAIDVYED